MYLARIGRFCGSIVALRRVVVAQRIVCIKGTPYILE